MHLKLTKTIAEIFSAQSTLKYFNAIKWKF